MTLCQIQPGNGLDRYQTPYTANHFLIECRALALIKQLFLNTDNIKDPFENDNMDDILSLREIKLYQKL